MNFKNITILWAICVISISNVVYAAAAPSKTLTLNDAITLALRYNPDIQSAEMQRVIDKFNLRLAHYNQFEVQYALTGQSGATYTYTNTVSNGGSPTITDPASVSSSATWLATRYGTQVTTTVNNQLNHTFGNSRFYNPGATVTISQPLLQGSSPDVVMKPWYDALDAERQAKLDLKNTVMTQVTNVINKYNAVVSDQNTILSNQQNLQSAQQTLQYNQAKTKVGQFAPADLIQSQSDISTAQVNVQQGQLSFLQDKYALLTLLGLDPNTPITLPNDVNFGDETLPSLQQAIDYALQNNISYQSELINLRNKERALTLAKDQQRWQLNLTASRTQGGGSGGAPNSGLDSLVNGQNKSTMMGLTFSVPIGPPTQQKLVNAKVGLDQERIVVAKIRLDTITSVTTSYKQLLIQQEQVADAKQAITWAEKNYNLAQIKAKYGRATPLDVSTVRNALTTAQINYLGSETSYLNNLAGFEATIGTTLDHWKIHIRY